MPINSNPAIDALVEAGEYEAAAKCAETDGQLPRAAELYEQIWQFADAARCAREAGDLKGALRNAIEARDDEQIAELVAELRVAGDGTAAAIDALEKGRRFDQAARLAEEMGDTERAIELYGRGHIDMDAARLLASAGRDREAGRLLERVLTLGEGGEDLPTAQLLLGQILARRMQHDQAVRHLQDAARFESTRVAANRSLVVELAALGLRSAARDVLVRARAHDPDLPATVDELIRDERATVAPRRTSDRDVVAGRYRLDELLGSGGAGRVFRARDEVSGRDVALKLWSTELARGNQAYERFVREAKVASTLRHANLVECFGFSAEMGYMVMELMAGSLADRLETPMAERAVRRMALDMLAGLELAHQRGIVHRDVKPANVFFDARGIAKLGDFGVAHLTDLGQTQTGGLIGTLAYMAPEQITGAPLTITADLYAVGVTLFEALTGRPPFLGPDFVAQHLGDDPPAPSSLSEINAGWDPLIAKLLAKSPTERFESIEELRKALTSLELGERGDEALVIPRPSEQDIDPRTSARMPAVVMKSEERDPEEPRYQFETSIGRTELSTLARALDTALDRSVIIERFDLEKFVDDTRHAIERRLYALARGGGPFMQRALSYDRHEGVVVYEAPAGKPLREMSADEFTPRLVARLLKRLARALAPLHERGAGHGHIGAATVLVDSGFNPTILTSGLGPNIASSSPEQDCAAVIAAVAEVIGVKASDEGLLKAIAPELSHPEAVVILAHGSPDDAESLYAFAHSAEVAALKIWRAGWAQTA